MKLNLCLSSAEKMLLPRHMLLLLVPDGWIHAFVLAPEGFPGRPCGRQLP